MKFVTATFKSPRGLCLLLIAVVVSLALPISVLAQARPVRTGAIEGVVSTQGGSIQLGGAAVVVRNAADVEIVTQATDADGRYRVSDLPPGTYRVVFTLDGFVTKTAAVVVIAGQTAQLDADLGIASIAATVEVVAPTLVTGADTLSSIEAIGAGELERLSPGSGVAGALRLLASVIEVPGGLSIKGGRPSQAGMQIGSSMFTDPSLGLAHMNLPDDAIDTVSVLPNPYAVEYGRFSSGLVVIQTRRASDMWKVRINTLDPNFRTERHKDYKITGVSGFSPRVEVGGPIVKERLFVEQTAQYKYSSDDIPSRPIGELRTTNWLSSFTRVDANLSTNHTLTATGGFFPKVTTFASLGTFTPPDATVDVHDRVNHVTATERAIWSERLISESTVQFDQYKTRLLPQGSAPMLLGPEGAQGNFFNTQERTPSALQLVETVSGTYDGFFGPHLFKLGADVLRTHYTGTSVSRPVLINRYDGTLARRLDFGGSTAQDVTSTDLAIFAQDRVQSSPRWNLEYGARLDRDGVMGNWNLTPRVGVAVLLNESGSAVLRGGFGLFFERTPSVAGAFGQFERTTDTRFAADGVTALGPPITFAHVTAPDLATARSATWDLSYDLHLNPQWSFHASVLERHGSNELVVDPQTVGTAGQLLLTSDGRSKYRSIEAGVDFSHSTVLGFNVTYTRSMARSDYNAFSNYFDAMLQPVIEPNAYGPAAADVPNRLFARGSLFPIPRILLVGIVDWRNGFPYTAVNDSLEFVGERNGLRFPNRFLVELGIEGRFHIGKFQPWIGIRANNAFESFAPSDVQANLGSPEFGNFYNSPYRQFRLQVRFER